MEAILGLEPINSGELLVLGYPRLHRIVGYFSTQTTQAGGGLTWETRPIEDRVSCVSDAATDSTPQGVMFAAPGGIYLYHGGRAEDVMRGRVKNLWAADLLAGAVITGGGYIGNDHYYVSTTARHFLCNMEGFRWSDGGLTSIDGAVPDPTRPNRYYGFRKNPGTAADTTKVFRLDTVLDPSSANKTDAHAGWGGPSMRLQTRVFSEGDIQRLKRTNHVYLTLRVPGSGTTVTVTATPGVDGEETPIVLGTFANATSAVMKRFLLNAISRGMALKIERTAGAPDELELVGLKIASVRLNEYRDV
jgi:hypothetical protein